MLKKILFMYSLLLCGAVAPAQVQEGLALRYMVQQPSVRSEHPPVIILLHGYSSDERDMFELRNVFPKNYLIISARAPTPTSNGGYQWFERAQGADGRYNGLRTDVNKSRALLTRFVGQVVSKYKADPRSVYMMGFSQGAIMSYEVGLTAPQLLKGIGIFSGVLFPETKLLIRNTPELKRLKIFVSHGTTDDRLPYADGKAAVDYLKYLGLKPDFHTYQGMGHSISNDVVRDMLVWLK